MYSLLRQLAFLLDPEVAHDLSLNLLSAAERLRLLPCFRPKIPDDPVTLMGLRFSNPVGLAAGLDKNGDYFNALGCLGFGFVEIGTITPKPQPGNPRPRLFRLADHRAIINRMGFNNQGVDYLLERVRHRRFQGVLGINIGKNKVTPEADALTDYQLAMTAVYPYADYITVNISSPNTPGLRNLQFGENLKQLLAGLKHLQQQLSTAQGTYKPIVVKIAPDMDETAVKSLCDTLHNEGIDGVIATNTTLARDAVSDSPLADEAGGLSGAPLTDSATAIIQQIRAHLSHLPIIGVGGIMQAGDAVAKLQAGANLVQLYSGFIYAGPALIQQARQAILEAY
ncbi:MAG: quinone-dependent dihydroorotate dehydrogenase [Cellvibrionaceae bacterium]|nr:quinone-dependent dihydroorotate dehydrogenase [Cellvibrionaceae bacterium]